MTAFPPRERLTHVVASLVRRLPGQCATLLAADRFAEGREAIGRLADPDAAAAGARAMTPDEADWMADLLLQRWARIGTVELDPAVAIVGPAEIWLSSSPCEVTLSLATLGLDPDWQADWSGDARALEDGSQAIMRVAPDASDGGAPRRVRVRVAGRAAGGRCLVGAMREIRVRRPVVSLSADGRTLTLRDEAGEPGRAVAISLDGGDHVTDAGGQVVLAAPPTAGAALLVAGQPVATATVPWHPTS